MLYCAGGGDDPLIQALTQGFSNASQSTPKQVTVTTSTTVLLAANASRRYAHFINNSASPVFMQYGSSAVANQGIKLNMGAIWSIDTAALWTGSVNAVVASGSVSIDVFEATV